MARVVCVLFLLLSLVGCSSPAAPTPAHAATGGVAGEVRLWQDAAIFQLVSRLIDTAEHRVLVEMYELGRADIIRSLGSAHARGVAVRVITDPTVAASRKSARMLDVLRVSERVYPVDDARHQIDHVKMLVADDEAAIGGMNWGKNSGRNHDYVLEIRNRAEVDRAARIFDQDWALAGGRPSPLAADDSPIAQTAPGGEVRTMLARESAHAAHRILAEIYTLTDGEVMTQLAVAHRHGAIVRVLLDPNQVYNIHAYNLLRASGVEARWYPIPKGALLHAKIGLFDGDLVLGSANWTLSGLDVNHELDVETSDPNAVQTYLDRFESDWSRSG